MKTQAKTEAKTEATAPAETSVEAKLEAMMQLLAAQQAKIEELETKPARDRGPKSTRDMTAELAWEVRYGKLASKTTMQCAKHLGLSYGQVYSTRGDYTFRSIHEESFHYGEDGTIVKGTKPTTK